MSDLKTLMNERLKKSEYSSKMAALAKQSANGQLTSFSGIFSVSELSDQEKIFLENILKQYSIKEEDVHQDLTSLISITSEVKAINNQAAILHGERIKKAQTLLTRYRDGAFSTWLIATYGNRQTPYNFLQYYEFYEAMPKLLRPQIEAMPRQAIYTLASREGDLQKKQMIVETFNGQTKEELLKLIRETFPLPDHDKRRPNGFETMMQSLHKIYHSLNTQHPVLTKGQKREISDLIDDIRSLMGS